MCYAGAKIIPGFFSCQQVCACIAPCGTPALCQSALARHHDERPPNSRCISDMDVYTSWMPDTSAAPRIARARSRPRAKQANMRPADTLTPIRVACASMPHECIAANARELHVLPDARDAARAVTGNSFEARPICPEKNFSVDAESTHLNASFARNCATFANPQTHRAHRKPMRAMEVSQNFFRDRAIKNSAIARQCSSLSINSAYASGSSSSSLSSARLLGLTTKIQPSPKASSLIVSGFSASALLTATTLPDTGA